MFLSNEPLEQAITRPEPETAGPDNSAENQLEHHETKEATNPNAPLPTVLGSTQKVDAVSTAHGPKFLCLSKENQQAIIKAHTNLGHPSHERLKVVVSPTRCRRVNHRGCC